MTNPRPVIAVDAMGGDHGLSVVVQGAVEAAAAEDIRLLLVGDPAGIKAELDRLSPGRDHIEVVPSSQVASMEDKPSDVLRRMKDSSIQVASRLVKDGVAHGVVSAGNSGATVACGMFILGRIEGVDRPGLASVMPTVKGPLVLIDAGGTVDCKPHHLFQFGIMADVLAKDALGIENPRVGLLSIGEEEGKGNSQVRESFELFKMATLNFVGNVEGRDLFTGDVDVVVCDGFVGNVALKLSEGLCLALGSMLKGELMRDLRSRLGAALAKSALMRFSRIVDYAEYGGAPLLGLKGIALVCHGQSNAKAISSAVTMAATFVRKKTNDHLAAQLLANEEFTRFGRASAKH